MAEKKQKATSEKAVKLKYPLEIIRKRNRGNSLVKWRLLCSKPRALRGIVFGPSTSG